MGLNKRQRWAIGSAVLAVAALAADRMALIPGPSSASADSALAEGDAPRVVTTDDLVALASKLQGVCEAAPAWGAAGVLRSSRDPFESPWKAVEVFAQTDTPEAGVRAPTPVRALPELTAIVSTVGRGYAVLDGRPLSVGASRDGYTLIELTAESATIEADGSVYTLALRDRNILP